jgi:hypothetical protein
MATELERQRLRMDVGFLADDVLSLPDAAVDAIFVEAGERFSDPASIEISTRVITLRRMVMQAANEVDYTQNNTTEKASQRYDHLVRELRRWENLLGDAISAEAGAVRSGKPMQNPPRVKEYPEGFRW